MAQCKTSRSIKLFRCLYKKKTANYSTELLDSEIASAFASATDLKISSGPSELSIESQEITLDNYGENLRNNHTQFAYFKVTGGNLIIPHHDEMISKHADLFKSGFGSLEEATGDSTSTAELEDTGSVTVQSGDGADFEIGAMIKIAGESIHTITNISTDILTFSPDIPTGTIYSSGSTVMGLDTWNPQCLEDDEYYEMLIWDADEYWYLSSVKPSISVQSNDGGVPKQWQMNITAYSARQIGSSYNTALESVFDGITADTFNIATLNNKTKIAYNDAIVDDIISLTMNIERENTRWETDVNARGAVGSINDVTDVSGELITIDKTTYMLEMQDNDPNNIAFQSEDAQFAFFAPAAKLKSGQNPITENSGQNVAAFGVSYNEDHTENIAIYLGDI